MWNVQPGSHPASHQRLRSCCVEGERPTRTRNATAPAGMCSEATLLSMRGLLRLLPQALLFDGDVYHTIKARPRALLHGVLLLLLLGVALGLAGTAGAIVAQAALPDAGEWARAAGRGLLRLPVAQRLGPEPVARLVPLLAALVLGPRPDLTSLLTAPIGLLAGWLAYGLLAQAAARLLGGHGRLAGTLACTALAEAPRAILLVPLLPPLGVAAVGVEAWVLAARFQALRAAHGLDGWHAFWAALAAALALGLLHAAWAALSLWAGGLG